MILFPLFLIIGALAGLVAGLFGLGGGVVLVPLLLVLFSWLGFPADLIPVMAVASSLATIVVTALAAVYAHQRLGSIDWQAVRRLLPSIVVGSIAGAWLAEHIPSEWLKTFFAVFLIVVAFQILLQWRPQQGISHPTPGVLLISGGLIGLFSSLLGIGGGTLTVPLLVRFSFPMRVAVAVSSACAIPIAVAGTLSYGVLGLGHETLPAGSLGYVYLPAFVGITATSIFTAPLGAKLVHQLPSQTVRRGFAVSLLLIALKILYGNFTG